MRKILRVAGLVIATTCLAAPAIIGLRYLAHRTGLTGWGPPAAIASVNLLAVLLTYRPKRGSR